MCCLHSGKERRQQQWLAGLTGRFGVGCERGGGGSEAACRAAKRTAASEPWWDQFSMRSQQQSGFGKEGGKQSFLTRGLRGTRHVMRLSAALSRVVEHGGGKHMEYMILRRPVTLRIP